MKSILRVIADIFFLMRPTLLIPVWTILALGWITGGDQSPFTSWIGGGIPLGVLTLSFTAIAGFIFVLNQIADIEGDRVNGKLFILPEGHISVPFALTFAGILLVSGVAIPFLFLKDITAGVIILLSALLGFGYNIKPFSLKDRPWGGTWANFFGHGVLTYYVGWYAALLESGTSATTEELLWGCLYALSAGFANGAVYLTSTIPDADGDKRVGKHTFAVKYGARKTALTAAIFVTLSLGFSFILPYNGWVMWITALLSTILFWLFYSNMKIENSFATFRWPVVFLSVVMTLYIPVYALLVLFVVFVSRYYYKKRFNLNYPALGSEK